MAVQRAFAYRLRVAVKIVHAIQAWHPDPLENRKESKVPGVSTSVEMLVFRLRSASARPVRFGLSSVRNGVPAQ
jgi:hypothetical protein